MVQWFQASLVTKTNNSIGIAGIAGGNNSAGSKIIPYYTLGSAQAICAIYDAVGKGVKVINISFDFPGSSEFDNAITTAYNNGVTYRLCVWKCNHLQTLHILHQTIKQ
jgi:hypothetical protein